jgi:hypothetical protein
MTSARTQLGALLRLRWSTTRAPGVRLGLVLTALGVVYLAVTAARSAPYLEPAALASAVELAPLAFLGFAFLAVIAPLTAGGGNQVVPADQLVAFPVRPTTHFLGGLVMAPLNVVWALQLLTLTAETAYLTQGGSTARGALTATAFIVCATAFGQALAWWVAGLRQSRAGRRLVRGTALALLAGALVVVQAGLGGALLARTPTRTVVRAVTARPDEGARWLATTSVLVLLAAATLWLGSRACSWALRRPADSTARTDKGPVRRRATRSSPLRELVAVNRASAWRAPALRRGALVLAVLPGVAAAGAAVPWQSLAILPGLVAAGAGLLFGVNAFALEASGAVWLATLPHPPRLLAHAKVIVLTETVLAAVAVVLVAGSLRSPGTPTPAQLTAILSSALACTAVVVAVGMSRSVRRPHHAPLLGPRDSVAPPGALALASLQLSLPAAAIGTVLEASSRAGVAWLPALLAVPVVVLSAGSVRRSLAVYDRPIPRARVVSVVSAG